MILPLVALCCIVQEEHSLDPVLKLYDVTTHQQTSFIQQFADPLRTPEKSPKTFGLPPEHWEFPWLTAAYEKLIPGPKSFARFFVFSQDRKPINDTSTSVARMLERLWEYSYSTLKRDNPQAFLQGIVEVFLCKEGAPGGEQLFDEDAVNVVINDRNRPVTRTKVNTIYLYDLPTFNDPLEMAREVAHEYGHASLPGVGGYKEPEDWANGYLGERLYMRHLAEEMRAGLLGPDDAMGAKLVDIDKWLNLKVTPLVEEAAQHGPDLTPLKARDAKGMDNFMGLALYIDTILPESIFSRSLDLITNAEDLPEAALIATQEHEKFDLNIPAYLKGKQLWVPLGDGQIEGAKIEKRSAKWALILPSRPVVSVTPKRGDD